MEDNEKVEVEQQEYVPSALANNDEEARAEEPSVPFHKTVSTEKSEAKPRSIPPPGAGHRSKVVGFP